MAESSRRLLAQGVTWNGAYQVFETLLSFAAMLLLVRVIPPAEYGRAGVAVSLLALLNAFNIGAFAAHALQLPEGAEPDWSGHWTFGLGIQSTLIAACHALAGLCWLSPRYRPIAPLLHLATVGLLLDWPAYVRMMMLRRAMDFRRLRLLLALSNVLNLAVACLVGLGGGGAYALVLGGNVVMPVPFVIDLLVVHRWRPRPGWWRRPDVGAYRAAFRFGLYQTVSTLLVRSRGALEGVVLTHGVGYTGVGLLNRARALFALTAARPGAVLAETAYPLLARRALDPERSARHAALLVQGICLVLVPAAVLVALEGRALSRLLYGVRWVAADPLILPASIAGLGLGASSMASTLLLAANRLRVCAVLEALGTALAIPALGIGLAGYGVAAYAWAAAAGQVLGSAAMLGAASPLLARGWLRQALVPPAVGSALGAAATLIASRLRPSALPPAFELLVDASVYAAVLAIALRVLFPQRLSALLALVPGGASVSRWLRLTRPAVSSTAATQ